MSYSPLNNFVYSAAYAGCMSGMSDSNFFNFSLVEGDTASAAYAADIYAQTFDTAWNSNPGVIPNIFQVFAIQEACIVANEL